MSSGVYVRRIKTGFRKGNIPWNKGKKYSEEYRKKLSEAHKGKPGNFLGKHHSEETKRKISKALKGKDNHQLGKHHSEETKQRLRKANLGKKVSEETRRKLSLANKGQNNRLGSTITEEHKLKIGLANKGEKNTNWKGGITPLNKKIRKSHEYNNWRIAVFEKDNYTCQKCGDKSGKDKKVYLNAHHIKSFKDYPELRFEVSNGITYCEDCHKNNELHKGIQKLKVSIT